MHNLLKVKVISPLFGLGLIGLIALLCALAPVPVYAHEGSETIIAAGTQFLDGLIVAEDECGPGGYLIEGTDLCSHGSDVPPTDEELEEAKLALDSMGDPVTTVCIGDGMSGKRVQVLYVRASDKADRYESSLSMIRTIANNVGFFFDASAHLTGGNRLLYYVTTPECELDVLPVEIAPAGDDTLTATVQALSALGYNSPDRKYLIFMEASVYCGIATVVRDTQPGPDNISNHRPGYARVDRTCWNEIAATHELVHTMGGIQHDAPNASGGWHCTDEKDIMCYSDAPYYPSVRTVCSNVSYGQLLDCNNDDYFNTRPAADSYLATHWNVANSQFLLNFDNLAPDADLTLAVTSTTSSDYRVMLDIVGGEALTSLIDYVDLYADDLLLDTVTGDGFETVWPEPEPGVHIVKARVYFHGGARVFQELRVTVPEPEPDMIFLPLIQGN